MSLPCLLGLEIWSARVSENKKIFVLFVRIITKNKENLLLNLYLVKTRSKTRLPSFGFSAEAEG